ncbi:hypothetical protein CAPTEDRAFT_193696 [Capitella teleta]|uniref:Uncharacterized protein n=1 Tax=Capitella teleta TaxID=283909 RepID=R7T7S8_CAPTE|nr:hypothetical protein CAPTEDRAFT_193696 [Capitella teleta]|eukprot:ELT89704.1 hypothetical protein CAPTEDRAFT_193696 [Capitella teleta]
MPDTRSRGTTNIISNKELDLMIAEAIVAALQKTKEFFLKKIAEMQKVCDEQQLQIDELKEQVESNDVSSKYKQDIKNLTISNNNLEPYSRRSNIRIHGLAVEGNGECKEAVCEFIRPNLKNKDGSVLEVNERDIDAAHPLPSPPTSTSSKPSVSVKFHAKALRDRIIKSRRQRKGKPWSISEDLTANNVKLPKELKSSEHFSSAWSWGVEDLQKLLELKFYYKWKSGVLPNYFSTFISAGRGDDRLRVPLHRHQFFQLQNAKEHGAIIPRSLMRVQREIEPETSCRDFNERKKNERNL